MLRSYREKAPQNAGEQVQRSEDVAHLDDQMKSFLVFLMKRMGHKAVMPLPGKVL